MQLLASEPDRYWIVKTCTGGNAEGVELLQAREALEVAHKFLGHWFVAQEYVERPFLGLAGRKFHMRLYVAVTSWGPPARVLLYDEGLLFLSRHVSGDRPPSTELDVFSRLSNSVEGLPFAYLWRALDARGPDVAAEVRGRIVATLREVFGPTVVESLGDPAMLRTKSYACWDLFGLDMMLDADLTPLILEVNMGPNIWVNDHGKDASELLTDVKGPLLRQLVHWMFLYATRAPLEPHEAAKIEGEALLNFTRVL